MVRLLRFIDIQLWLPQLRAVLRYDLRKWRVVPAKLLRAIRPGSPIRQDASACPILSELYREGAKAEKREEAGLAGKNSPQRDR